MVALGQLGMDGPLEAREPQDDSITVVTNDPEKQGREKYFKNLVKGEYFSTPKLYLVTTSTQSLTLMHVTFP